jgi:uncharacterized protein
MKDVIPRYPFTHEPSAAAREQLLSRRGEPLFIAAWERVLMIHFEVEAGRLQRDVPFRLDLWNGRAFVSLVAFTLRGMRPRLGGKLAAMLFRPIARHEFLNVRTYVRPGDQCGIHFLAEWLPNLLAVRLGPATFGLPYRYGRMTYEHDGRSGRVRGCVADANSRARLVYRGELTRPATFRPCAAGSLDEWLMERYAAFNSAGGRKRFFRVWHPPWLQGTVELTLDEMTLLANHWPWFEQACLVGANYSPGFDEVWMGRPGRCQIVTEPGSCGGNWSERRDSNPRHSRWQRDALPD